MLPVSVHLSIWMKQKKTSNCNKDGVEICVGLCVIQEAMPLTGKKIYLCSRKKELRKMAANIFLEGKERDTKIAHFLA